MKVYTTEELRQSLALIERQNSEKESMKKELQDIEDKQIVNRVQKRVYSKDSMDRLGDDLTEELLQYLTFEDKIRLECVSKQWKRCVFQRQFVIEIDWNCRYSHNSLYKLNTNEWTDEEDEEFLDELLDQKALESVLNKCQNIMSVRLEMTVESEVLALFGRYCPRLKSIDYDFTNQNGFQFLQIYGHKLEKHYFGDFSDKDCLKLCPNLKSVSFREISLVLDESPEYLPKLEQIFRVLHFISPEEVKQINILVHKYRKSLKSLALSLGEFTAKELKPCIECISRFENLKRFKLDVIKSTEPIDDCLKLIGQKCTKLSLVYLWFSYMVPMSDRFFDVFTHFKAIKKLKLYLQPNRVLKGSVDCFKHCKQLTELDIEYYHLTEDFFTNIESSLPKLQLLEIKSGKQFSDIFINSFHSMKIQKVVHNIANNKNKTILTKCWYFGKTLFEVKASPNGKDMIDIGNNCGLVCTQVL